jgi:LPPG:FO 2-phospho-L-lactate transferase
MDMPENMADLKVVALSGGVGGAKLADGLARLLPPGRLTVIVNTADDFEYLGLHISPDLDTVIYTLADIANPSTGWGLKDESWNTLQRICDLGAPDWFSLGDKDLATHILRSYWLREGLSLSQVAERFCRALQIRQSVLPMSDDPVRTILQTDEGPLPFQDYFVRRHWEPVVNSISFSGIEQATPLPAFMTAVAQADLIVFCPSNPFVSMDPILSLPGLRSALADSRAMKIAVSPIVGGKALKGPAAKMMNELNLEISCRTVARHYQGLIDHMVIDAVDSAFQESIEQECGLSASCTDTIMSGPEERLKLAAKILEIL